MDNEITIPDVKIMYAIENLQRALTENKIPADKIAYKVTPAEARILAGEFLDLFPVTSDQWKKLKQSADLNYTATLIHNCTVFGIRVAVEGLE